MALRAMQGYVLVVFESNAGTLLQQRFSSYAGRSRRPLGGTAARRRGPVPERDRRRNEGIEIPCELPPGVELYLPGEEVPVAVGLLSHQEVPQQDVRPDPRTGLEAPPETGVERVMSQTRSSPRSDPNARVCPRCGELARDQPLCSSCGLNLAAQLEVPARTEWEAARRKAPAARTVAPQIVTRDVGAQVAPVGTTPPAQAAPPPRTPLSPPEPAKQIDPGDVAARWDQAPGLGDLTLEETVDHLVQARRRGLPWADPVIDAIARGLEKAMRRDDLPLVEGAFFASLAQRLRAR
jgi:hypothetical protein